VGVTALISGLTIGGKALGKTFAISRAPRSFSGGARSAPLSPLVQVTERSSIVILRFYSFPGGCKVSDEFGSGGALCGELRSFLVENVSQTGGHLASNLGTVELTVAIHRVFDTSKDRLVFDVGPPVLCPQGFDRAKRTVLHPAAIQWAVGLSQAV
jgi:hypothetical protein